MSGDLVAGLKFCEICGGVFPAEYETHHQFQQAEKMAEVKVAMAPLVSAVKDLDGAQIAEILAVLVGKIRQAVDNSRFEELVCVLDLWVTDDLFWSVCDSADLAEGSTLKMRLDERLALEKLLRGARA